MNVPNIILLLGMVIVPVCGTGTYYLPDLRTESGSTPLNMAIRAGIAVPHQMSDLKSQEPGVLFMRPGDVYAFSFPSPLSNNAILELHLGMTTKPCRFQITDATGKVMTDLNWSMNKMLLYEIRYVSTTNMMLPTAGFDTSKIYVKVLDYPNWPQWRDEYFTFLGTFVGAWETDTTEASEQVTLVKISEDNLISSCFVDDKFWLGPQEFPSTLPTQYFIANGSNCKLNLSATLASHQGALANSAYIALNGFRRHNKRGRLYVKDSGDSQLYQFASDKRGENSMVAMTFRLPTHWLQQMSGYYIELEEMWMSPYIKLKGSGSKSRVMNLSDAQIGGTMERKKSPKVFYDAAAYYKGDGEQLPFTGEMRRRRYVNVPVDERSGTLTFRLEASDLTDRPFMNILWWESNPGDRKWISLTDSTGKRFLKYEYPAYYNDMGASWETTFSLLGVAPGEINLTISGDSGYQFDPWFTLFKLQGSPRKMSDYNMSCPVTNPTPAHGGLGTFYLPNIQSAAGSTQMCMATRGGVSFPNQMSDLTSQDSGVLYMRPGDVYVFEFPMVLASTAVLELKLGVTGKASRFQVTDGSDSLMFDLNWLLEESGRMKGEGWYGLSTMMIPLAGFDTSKFHVKVLEYPDWPIWNSQHFSFLGTLVSVWEIDTTEPAEHVTLIKLPEEDNIDCFVDSIMVSEGTRHKAHAGFKSLLPAPYFIANKTNRKCFYSLSSGLSRFGRAMNESTYLEFNGFRAEDMALEFEIKDSDDSMIYFFKSSYKDFETSAFTFMVPTAWLAGASGYYIRFFHGYLSPFVKLKGSGHKSRVIDLSRSATIAGTFEKTRNSVPSTYTTWTEYRDPLGSWALGGRRRGPGIPGEKTGTLSFMLEEEDLGNSTFMEISWLQHGSSSMKVWLSDTTGNKFLKTDYTSQEESQGSNWKTTVSLRGVAPGQVNLTVAEDEAYQFYPFITLYRLSHTTSTTTSTTTATSSTSTATTKTETTSTYTTYTATTTTYTATTTPSTANPPMSPGTPLDVFATSMSLTAINCTEAKRMASSRDFCDACAMSMAGLLGLHHRHVSSTCTLGGSCSIVKVDYQISVPSGQSSSVKASLNSVAPSALESSITARLVGTVFQGSTNSVTALSQPTTTVSFWAFECYSGQSCTFNSYEIGHHYKTTGFNSTECGQACYADQACEAFETLFAAFGDKLPYQCAFWMHGACNIETAGSNAPGFVSGYPGVLFCTSRKPATSSDSLVFSLTSAIYCMILITFFI